jgi:NhaA family Na+:H+ antiporter
VTEPPRERVDELRVPWVHSDRTVPRRVVRPLQSFLQTEVASAMVLIAALVLAIAWANGPWWQSYERLWETPVGLDLGQRAVADDLRGWVNEGLMALFFLVVALEIKREFLTGELRDRRTAFLPVVAALGGMVVPALVFVAVTTGTPGVEGWGVAMPTDIALALGVLAFALPWAPPGLRILLLSLAIADDLGSIVVVAVAYSEEVAVISLLLAGGLALSAFALQRAHVRAPAAYVALGVGMWLALHNSGFSPTLAGVAMGFLTPAVALHRPQAVSREAHRVADETFDDPDPPDADAGQWLELARLSREAVSPLARVEGALHPWTSYVVVPLFVLANAGIRIGGGSLAGPASRRVVLAIVLARVLGKPLGIAAACLIAVRMRLARLPEGVSWGRLLAVGAVAGVPFTVSMFIAELSLAGPDLVDAAKVGIALSALAAGALGFVLLRRTRSGRPGP